MVNVKTYAMKDVQPIPNNEYLIGIHSNGNWIHSEPVMADADNVLNLKFEDVETTGLKSIKWYNNTQRIIHATACSDRQAKQIIYFLENILSNNIESVYILGDMFNYWLGDDCITDYHILIANKINKINQRKYD